MKKKYFNLMTALFLGTLANAQIVDNVIDDPGDIVITAYHNDDDGFSFVFLDNCPNGTTIRFVDEEWTGSAFASTTSEGEVLWENNSGTTIAQGTVVHITDADDNGVGIAASVGTATEIMNFTTSTGDELIAITGTRVNPGTFLTFYGDDTTNLANTSLVNYETALQHSSLGEAYYSGPNHCNGLSISDCAKQINTIENWTLTDFTFPDNGLASLNLSTVLSIVKLSDDAISLFPNPVQNTLHIKTDKVVQKVLIYNAMGQLIIEKDRVESFTKVTVSVLERGTYYMQVFSGDTFQTVSFFKE